MTSSHGIACLSAAPVLSDLEAWADWGTLYAPVLGPLPAFLTQHRAQLGFHVLEVPGGSLLKLPAVTAAAGGAAGGGGGGKLDLQALRAGWELALEQVRCDRAGGLRLWTFRSIRSNATACLHDLQLSACWCLAAAVMTGRCCCGLRAMQHQHPAAQASFTIQPPTLDPQGMTALVLQTLLTHHLWVLCPLTVTVLAWRLCVLHCRTAPSSWLASCCCTSPNKAVWQQLMTLPCSAACYRLSWQQMCAGSRARLAAPAAAAVARGCCSSSHHQHLRRLRACKQLICRPGWC